MSKATPSTLTSTVYATSVMIASVKSATTPTLPSAANVGRAPSAATPAVKSAPRTARTVEMLLGQSCARNALQASSLKEGVVRYVRLGAPSALHSRSAILARTDFT